MGHRTCLDAGGEGGGGMMQPHFLFNVFFMPTVTSLIRSLSESPTEYMPLQRTP